MTTCFRCTAQFSSDPATEGLWREIHIRRFHDDVRATAHTAKGTVIEAASTIAARRLPTARAERPDSLSA